MMCLWMAERLQCGRLQSPERWRELLLKSNLGPFHVLMIPQGTDNESLEAA